MVMPKNLNVMIENNYLPLSNTRLALPFRLVQKPGGSSAISKIQVLVTKNKKKKKKKKTQLYETEAGTCRIHAP